MPKPYARIADKIAGRILNGEYPIGFRLPPQRSFAFEEGIAVSTASRVYSELKRRGLVTGEIGRGTYVTNRFSPLDPLLQEPSSASIDLEIVFRLGETSRELIAASTLRFFKKCLTEAASAPPSIKGSIGAQEALSRLASSANFCARPETLLLAGSGKEAIAASFSALAPRGGRIAVEALTYPFVISIARVLGIELVPLALDEEGIDSQTLDREASIGLNGVYLQPTLQSPLVLTMSNERRKAVAEVLIRRKLIAIEDRVYGFLAPTTPLAAFAPEHVIQIDSLSKRLMPGMSVGFIIAPLSLHHILGRSLRSGGWMAPALSVELARHWIDEGIVASVEDQKRTEARAMYDIAKKTLNKVGFRGADGALHGWISLPAEWRGESFSAASAQLGIAVAPGHAFAVTPGTSPSGVRIAYSARNIQTWEFAVRELGRIARQKPQS